MGNPIIRALLFGVEIKACDLFVHVSLCWAVCWMSHRVVERVLVEDLVQRIAAHPNDSTKQLTNVKSQILKSPISMAAHVNQGFQHWQPPYLHCHMSYSQYIHIYTKIGGQYGHLHGGRT